MWGALVVLVFGVVMGGLGMLGAVLTYAKRHPGLLIHAAFEYGLDLSCVRLCGTGQS